MEGSISLQWLISLQHDRIVSVTKVRTKEYKASFSQLYPYAVIVVSKVEFVLVFM